MLPSRTRFDNRLKCPAVRFSTRLAPTVTGRKRRLSGIIEWDPETEGALPLLIGDGRTFTWDQIGRMLHNHWRIPSRTDAARGFRARRRSAARHAQTAASRAWPLHQRAWLRGVHRQEMMQAALRIPVESWPDSCRSLNDGFSGLMNSIPKLIFTLALGGWAT